jgi:hypothetical protein
MAAVTPITPFNTNPYLTLAEYKNAPTAIDYNNLVVGGDSDQQDAELQAVIQRASSWIDVHCNQPLGAQYFTEQNRTRITPEGFLVISPDYNNVVALTALSYGVTPTNLTTVDSSTLSQTWMERSQMIYPLSQLGLTYSSQGPLSFGFPPAIRSRIYVNYTYVAGFTNTYISSATAGDTTFTVLDPTGITPSDVLTIYDGKYTEVVKTTSDYTFGSSTVTITTPLAYNHSSGVSVGSLPQAIKEAAILVTTDFLKVRGDNSLTMAVTTRATSGPSVQSIIGSDLALAIELLRPFRRMR